MGRNDHRRLGNRQANDTLREKQVMGGQLSAHRGMLNHQIGLECEYRAGHNLGQPELG